MLPTWMKSKIRELFCGIFFGSIAAIVFPYVRGWLAHVWFLALVNANSKTPNFRAPAIIAAAAFLLLIAPRFLKKTHRLCRSYRAGIVRGSIFVWASAVFLCWTYQHTGRFILAGLIFEVLPLLVRRNAESCSRQDIERWIPTTKANLDAVGFDKPIEDWGNDAIGRQEFVKTILTRILVDQEPAIGITADFGEGKSSVLHLIEKSIRKGNKAIVVPFRTWLPETEEVLLASLFDTADIAIREQYFLPTWRSVFRKYRRAMFGIMPKGWEFAGELLPADSQSKQVKELTDLFAKLPIRVIFLLDEIDRMHAEELQILLKVLRGAPEVANVSYVCAFSKDALARMISPADIPFGFQYLEKFFPVQLELPKIDEDVRDCLFSDSLFNILNANNIFESEEARKNFGDAERSLWFNALEGKLTNFRIMGQVLRGFQSTLQVIKDEVNAFDLLVLECVRLLLPTTYQFLYQYSDYFHDLAKGGERWYTGRTEFEIDKGAKKKVTFEVFDRFFNTLTQSERDLARDLLSQVFPAVREYFREKFKGVAYLSISNVGGGRRLQDARFFTRYFTHTVPATRFGEREIKSFIDAIRETDEAGIKAEVEHVLPATERNDLRRIDFFRRLQERVGQIPKEQARWLALDISERTGTMYSDQIVYIVAKSVIFSIAAQLQGTPDMQRLLDELVRRATSDRFASDIVYSSVSQKDATQEITNWNVFNPEEIKKAFGERMRLHHLKPVTALLPSNVDDPLAFSRWKLYVPNDAPYIKDFFRSAFDFDIRNLGVFLQWLLPGNVAYEGSPIKFVESFYLPISDIAKRLRQAEKDKVQWNANQIAAIERFWNFLNADGRHEVAPNEINEE